MANKGFKTRSILRLINLWLLLFNILVVFPASFRRIFFSFERSTSRAFLAPNGRTASEEAVSQARSGAGPARHRIRVLMICHKQHACVHKVSPVLFNFRHFFKSVINLYFFSGSFDSSFKTAI